MVTEKLKQYIDFKGISLYEIENKLSVGRGTISKSIKENKSIGSKILENILTIYDDINPTWLITGMGEMLKESNNKKVMATVDNIDYLKQNGIPLLPVKAMAGIGNGGGYQIMDSDVEDYLIVPKLMGVANCAFTVSGDSMEQTYFRGDFVICKRIFFEHDYVQYNKAYVLDTAQGAMVKRLIKSKSEANFICRSDNKQYDDFEIPKNTIENAALVLAVVRLE
jgi:repressor LexA